jgi:hypothetical protein
MSKSRLAAYFTKALLAVVLIKVIRPKPNISSVSNHSKSCCHQTDENKGTVSQVNASANNRQLKVNCSAAVS